MEDRFAIPDLGTPPRIFGEILSALQGIFRAEQGILGQEQGNLRSLLPDTQRPGASALYIRQGDLNLTQGFLLHEPNLTDLMDRYFDPIGAAWWPRDPPSGPPAAQAAPDRKV